MTPDTIAIILGRKNSKGIKDKNVMNILGKPAFFYPIEAAKKSKFIKQIFVSTDHPAIAKECDNLKLNLIKRPEHLNTDEALFEDALVYSYKEAKKLLKKKPKYVVVLMCNAVTVNEMLIDQAINALENNKEADSAVTVSIFNMYSPLRARKINNKGYLDPFVPFESFGDPKTLNCDRGSQGDSYFADMSHSVVRNECLENIAEGLLPQKWMGKKILPIKNDSGCDIDSPWQIDMSVRWLKNQF